MRAEGFLRERLYGVLVGGGLSVALMTACTLPVEPGMDIHVEPGTPAYAPTATLDPNHIDTQSNLAYQPIWRCGTPTPQPTGCSTVTACSSAAQPTTCVDTTCTTPGPTVCVDTTTCATPQPTATTYQLVSSFPIGRHVQVGPIGRSNLGVWVWLEDVNVEEVEIPSNEGPTQRGWVASWTIVLQSTCLCNRAYEFIPPLTSFVGEVGMQDGSTQTSTWYASDQAMAALGIWDPENHPLSQENALVFPGTTHEVQLAAIIPGPVVRKIVYVVEPGGVSNDAYPGGKKIIWNTYPSTEEAYASTLCPSEVTPGPDGIDAQVSEAVNIRLPRWPVNSQAIVRGYGCVEEFTGVRGSNCPTNAPWFHNGIDIAVPAGMDFVATLSGESMVDYAGPNTDGVDCSNLEGAQEPKRGLGNYVLEAGQLDGHPIRVWGGHLSSLSVSSGEAVTERQVLGLTGSTGCSTAPHLHFMVEIDGQIIDPLWVLP